jgi:transaldolase
MTFGVNDLRIKIFADGADRDGILKLRREPLIRGFTTNPTLMRAAGVTDYEVFAREVLEVVPRHPISFEILSDDFDEMERQARKIATWGDNVFVKVPVTNTRRESSFELVQRLATDGVQLNVTALMTVKQVELMSQAMADGAAGYISVFAGRIADTGRDPVPIMLDAVETLAPYPHLELIWASPREVLNIFQADAVGCQVITVTHDLLRKLRIIGKDLDDFSLETVRMFHDDAEAAGYTV